MRLWPTTMDVTGIAILHGMKSLTLMSFAFLASSACASECTMKSPKTIAESAQIAFVGTVVWVQESQYKPSGFCWPRSDRAPKCGGKLVTAEVTEHLLGRVPSRVEVVSEDACHCLGSYWNVGSNYLIVASQNGKNLRGDVIAENVCSGTGELSKQNLPIVKALRSAKR